jgi:hypothetical protein
MKKVFFAFFLITSFSNFTSQAMENSEEEDANTDEDFMVIKKEWSEDGNYLKITIDGVVWKFGPFDDPKEENQNNSNTIVQEKTA